MTIYTIFCSQSVISTLVSEKAKRFFFSTQSIFTDPACKVKAEVLHNKYGSAQELRSTFRHLKTLKILQSFVKGLVGLDLVWSSLFLVHI